MSAQGSRVFPLLVPTAITLGCIALATRPFTMAGTLVAMSAVGLIGVLGPVARRGEDHPGRIRWLAVTTLGVAAFAAARALRPHDLVSAALPSVGLTALAAVAEEAFFRRLLYGWLAPGGSALAIGGSALAFAVVHIPGYGSGALPIDLAAGLLFGWQRWATGGWAASAVTHVMANLLQMR